MVAGVLDCVAWASVGKGHGCDCFAFLLFFLLLRPGTDGHGFTVTKDKSHENASR